MTSSIQVAPFRFDAKLQTTLLTMAEIQWSLSMFWRLRHLLRIGRRNSRRSFIAVVLADVQWPVGGLLLADWMIASLENI